MSGDARILIVDDVSQNLRLVEAVLARRGYDVISATDGDGALELVASAKPDLVLLDVVMPQPDGYTVCRRLRERVETAVLPVIMVTASPGEKTKAIQADGASDLDQNYESRQAGHPPAGLTSGPPGTRTRNLRIKSPLLYPIELEARGREYTKLTRLDRGVTEGTRTPNPQDHNLVL
jgi:CheY-like chemotaxis protein